MGMSASYCPEPLSPMAIMGPGVTLSTSERMVYLVMASAADPGSMTSCISVGKLVTFTGMTKATVRRAREGLVQAKAIELMNDDNRSPEGGNWPNVYRMTAGHLDPEHHPVTCPTCFSSMLEHQLPKVRAERLAHEAGA